MAERARLRGGRLASLRRDRGHARSPTSRSATNADADQDRLAVALRPHRQVQPAAAHRGGAGRRRELSRARGASSTCADADAHALARPRRSRVLIVALQYPMWLGKGGWLQVRESTASSRRSARRTRKLKARNDALDADVRDLKTGSEAIEERARTELGMIRQDEVFFQVQTGGAGVNRAPRRRAAGRQPAPRIDAPDDARVRRTRAVGMRVQRVTSRNNPRLREVARLIASSRDRRKIGPLRARRRASGRRLHRRASARRRRWSSSTTALDDPAIAQLIARVPPIAHRSSSRARVFAESRDAAAGRRRAGGGRRAASRRRQRPARFLPAARGRAGPRQRRLDAAHGGGRGRRPGRAVAACAFAWSPKVLRAGQGAHFLTTIVEDVDLPAWATHFARRAATSSRRRA